MIVNEAANAFLERLTAEVQKQPDGLLEQSDIYHNLLGVDRLQLFY